MMKTEIKEIYKCDYCNKLYQIKGYAEKHEITCSKNPENERVCMDCVHLKKKAFDVYFDNPMGGEFYENKLLLHCEKQNLFLYPPTVEHKKNWFDLGDDINEPMRKECVDYTDIFMVKSQIKT